MKRLFLILSLVSVFMNVCLAQSSVWKLEGKGNTVYVGGTMHLLSAEDYPLPPEFDSAYARSEFLVFEADIKKMEEPAMMQKVMMMAMYQDDRTMKSEISEETYQLLESECAKLDISLANFSKFKPGMVLLIYAVTKMQQSGLSEDGVDQYYYSLAISDHKDVLFLERIESQLELMFGEDDEDYDQAIRQFFDDQKKMDRIGDDIKDSWRKGKDKIFIRMQKEMEKEYPEIYKKILTNRNMNWISEIDSYLDSEEVEFVMVGALHLPGPEGVLEMLKDKGYKLSQLSPD